jgi:hypothetical protein
MELISHQIFHNMEIMEQPVVTMVIGLAAVVVVLAQPVIEAAVLVVLITLVVQVVQV